MSQLPKVVELVQTCDACPAQWDGLLDDGRAIYIRYRWGFLEVLAWPTRAQEWDNDVEQTLVEKSYGDEYNGFLMFSTLVELTSDVLDWSNYTAEADQ